MERNIDGETIDVSNAIVCLLWYADFRYSDWTKKNPLNYPKWISVCNYRPLPVTAITSFFLIRSLSRKKVKWFFEQRLYVGTLKKKKTEKKRWRHWDELETSSSRKDTNRNLVLVKINKTRSIIQYSKIINIFHENFLNVKYSKLETKKKLLFNKTIRWIVEVVS